MTDGRPWYLLGLWRFTRVLFERFKALAGISETALIAFVSADGVHWRKLRSEAVIPKLDAFAFDSQNQAFWSETEQQYVCYFRTWKKVDGVNYRWISRTTSSDFRTWNPSQIKAIAPTAPDSDS
jgi:hypothetical protein